MTIASSPPSIPDQPRPWAPLSVLRLLLLLALFCAAAGGQPATQDGLRPVSVQLQWRHQWQFAGFYAALAQGYYRDAGLDVRLIEGGPDIDPAQAVLAGRADFGTAPADLLLRRRADGDQLKLLATYVRRSPMVFVVRPGLLLPRDLGGKRVMTSAAALDWLNVRAMLRRADLTLDDIELVPYASGVDAFVRGEVDALMAYRANEVFDLLRRGIPFGILDPSDYGVSMPDQNLFTSANLAQTDPDTAAALAAATTRGWSYALEHVDELVSLIRARWNTQGKSAEHLRFEAHQTHSAMLPEVQPIGLPRRDRLAAVADLMREIGTDDGVADLDALLSYAVAPTLALSEAEREFRDAHPRLSLRYASVPPFVEGAAAGPSGYAVELMERVARRAGFTLRWREDGLEGVHAQLLAGSADLTINSIRTPQREGFLTFSERAYPVQLVIVARRGRWDLNSLSALAGRRVAHVAGDPLPELFASCGDDLTLVGRPDFVEALHAVADRLVDAAIVPRQVAVYLLERERLAELTVVAEIDPPEASPLEAHPFAVRSDLPLLVSILDKAYAALPRSELLALWSRWFGDDQSLTYLNPGRGLELTAAQRQWLGEQARLRILYPETPPYAMTRNGRATGYSVERVRQATRVLGLDAEFVGTSMGEALSALRDRRADAVLNVVQTPEREAWLRFGRAGARLQFRVFGRTDAAGGGLPVRWASLFAVPREQAMLADLLDAAMAALPQASLERTHAQFLGDREVASSVTRIALSAEERAFLDAHPVITLGADPDWAPLSYRDADGNPAGIDLDTIEAINQLLGSDIRIELGEWSDLVERAMRYDIDGLAASLPNPERAERLAFSTPYAEQVHAVFVPAGNPLNIRGPDDLARRRVGYAAGVKVIKQYLHSIPGVQAVALTSGPDAVNALLAGGLDAVVGTDLTLDFLFAGAPAPVMELAYTLGEPVGTVFSIRRDWPLLLSALDKALAALPPRQREQIRQRHLGPFSPPSVGEVRLSFVEREYLAAKGNHLRYCFNPVWRPYDYRQDGEHRGLFKEFLDLFADKLGVTLEPVPSVSWAQSLDLARERHCDFVSGAVRTAEREAYLDFTAPFYSLTHVLIAGEGRGYVRGVDAFAGQRVAVPDASAIEARLRSAHEAVEFVAVSEPKELIHALRSGEVAAAVSTLEHAAELVDQAGGQLRIIGQLEAGYPVSVATRNDEPLLRMAMDKALAAVTPAERDAIELKQTKFTIEEQIDLTHLWQLLGIGLLLATILLYRQRELERLNRDLTRARDAARVADAAKTRFLANISHEIRTPMNAIMGMARLCLGTRLDREQRGWLERQQQASRSLLGLIDDLLDVASLAAGGVSLRQAPFSPDDVLDRVQGVADLAARERGLMLWFDVDPQLPEEVVGDAQRLEQVLLNLTANGIKFTHRGEVRVQVERLGDGDRVAGAGDARLRFSVTDTGIGIDPAEVPGLFEPFGQSDGSATRAYKGSGLGLSISRELVRLMGGDIHVDSAPGEGSRFRFELRLPVAAPAMASSASPGSATAADVATGPLLVLDPHDGRAAALLRQLRGLGLDATRVADLDRALAEVRAEAGRYRDPPLILALDAPSRAGGLAALRAACMHAGARLIVFCDRADAAALPLPASRKRLLAAIRQALPEPPGAAEAVPSRLGTDDRLWGRRVLLAEDNEANRTYVRELLRREGCWVEGVVNGLAAVARAIEEPFDAILMDLQMPELDGLSAARRIRDALGEGAPPIIALTAHARQDGAGPSLEAGMCAHLVKPVTPDTLHAALLTALTGRARTSPDRGLNVDSAATASGDDASLDLVSGLARAAGDAQLFRRVAHSFRDEHAGDPGRLRVAALARDPDAVQRIAHRLKGVAILVGAPELQHLAETALLELRRNGDWPGVAERLAERLESVLARLSELLSDTDRAR
jgi:signal transduction histidine kinase/CheY-like chemotaxis protein/HPt (histidine-containing phosphotransfer) domain-containing protein